MLEPNFDTPEINILLHSNSDSFGILLSQLLKRCKRPGVPLSINNDVGNIDSETARFAKNIGVRLTTVNTWLEGTAKPGKNKGTAIVGYFFATNEQFSTLYDRFLELGFPEYNRGALQSELQKTSICKLVWDEIFLQLGQPSDGFDFEATSIYEAEGFLVSEFDSSKAQAEALLISARRRAFDIKYGKPIPDHVEERQHLASGGTWFEEFSYVLDDFASVDREGKTVCVGIGRYEEELLAYSNFNDLSCYDISPRVVAEANTQFVSRGKNVCAYEKSAENLADGKNSVPYGSVDTYISLRTFSSTYFDLFAAVNEIRRVLKPGGVAIISIPLVYVSKEKSCTYGLSRPVFRWSEIQKKKYYMPSRETYPLDLVRKVARTLSFGFDTPRIHSGFAEHYIAVRRCPIRNRS